MIKKRRTAYLYILSATAIWGIAGPVIKFTLDGINVLDFLTYRFIIAGFIALLYFWLKKPKIPKRNYSISRAMFTGTLSFSIAMLLAFTGIDNTSVLELALIGTIGPLLVMAGGAVFFHDRITHREKLGTAIALTGTLITILVPAIMDNEIVFTGNMLILAAMGVDLASSLFSKKYMRQGVPPAIISNIGLITAAVTYLIGYQLFFGLDTLWHTLASLPLQYHLGVWYMAVFAGVIAYFLWLRGSRTIEISEAGLFSYLSPLFSVPLAILWLGESITLVYIVGAVVIATGVFIAERKRHLRRKSTLSR